MFNEIKYFSAKQFYAELFKRIYDASEITVEENDAFVNALQDFCIDNEIKS